MSSPIHKNPFQVLRDLDGAQDTQEIQDIQDILEHTLSFLDISELAAANRVSRFWHETAKSFLEKIRPERIPRSSRIEIEIKIPIIFFPKQQPSPKKEQPDYWGAIRVKRVIV